MFKYLLFVFSLCYAFTAKADVSEFVFPEYLDDEAYEQCYKLTHNSDECAKEESQRVLRDIKISYKNLLADGRLNDWNGSVDKNKDMLRDMYESWTAYRNRVCSLNAYVQKIANPQKPVSFDYCIQYYNENFAALLDLYLKNANSVLDEDMYGTDNEPEEGGAEEGRSITPLKRRIVTDLDNSVVSTATEDEDGETALQAETVSAPETTDKRGRQLPSWATR